MTDEKRWNTTPQEHIRNLFESTENDELTITYYHDTEEPCNISYNVRWNEADAEALIQKFDTLICALQKIGQIHDQLETPENRENSLNKEELSVWETYIRPFDEFEVELSVIGELYLRGEYDELSEEENELLERHSEWYKSQSLTRLPCKQCSPEHVINRAQRYERLVALGAPECVRSQEARCLAEEMILYYYSK